MAHSKNMQRVTAIAMALALLVTVALMAGADSYAAYALQYEDIFDKGAVMTLDIQVDGAAWEEFLVGAQDKEYIQVDMRINDQQLRAVGLRAKGNSTLSQVTGNRYSFKIEFDHYITGQTLLGLDKMVVNNIQSDTTYMKEFLAYETLAQAGVATPLHCYAWITVNGEPWGLYLAVEALEESFLLRNYGTNYGMLYKPDNYTMDWNAAQADTSDNSTTRLVQQMISALTTEQATQEPGATEPPAPDEVTGGVTAPLVQEPMAEVVAAAPVDGNPNRRMAFAGGEMVFNRMSGGAGDNLVYTDDDFGSYSTIFDGAKIKIPTDADKARMIESLRKMNAAEDLEQVVDVDAMLRYIAANVLLVNLDSYFGSMTHNYYLYEKNGQLTMLPWDYNLALSGFGNSDASAVVNLAIDTAVSGASLEDRPIIKVLLENEAYLQQYHGYLEELVTPWVNGVMDARVEELNEMIAPYVAQDPTAFTTMAQYEAGLPVLKEYFSLRGQSVMGQLKGSIPSTTEAQNANKEALLPVGDFSLNALGSQMGGMVQRVQGGDNPRMGWNDQGVAQAQRVGQSQEGDQQGSRTEASLSGMPQGEAFVAQDSSAAQTEAQQGAIGGNMPEGQGGFQMPEGMSQPEGVNFPESMPEGMGMPAGVDVPGMSGFTEDAAISEEEPTRELAGTEEGVSLPSEATPPESTNQQQDAASQVDMGLPENMTLPEGMENFDFAALEGMMDNINMEDVQQFFQGGGGLGTATPATDNSMVIAVELGISVVVLAGGLLFVRLFRRRRLQ